MKKKIALIAQHLAEGGAEKIAAELSLSFSKLYDVFLILYNNKIDYEYKGKLITINSSASRNPFKKIMNAVYRIIKIKKIKKNMGITHSISFLDGPNIINIFTKKNEKVILSVQVNKTKSCREGGFYGLIYKYLIKKFFIKADIIIAISNGIKKDLHNKFNIPENKICIINNFCSIHQVYKLLKKKINNSYEKIFKHPTIINIGRLTRQKGHRHLIRVYNDAGKYINNLKLIILGEGELEEYLINSAESLGLKVYSIRKKSEINEHYDVYFLGFHKNPFQFISRSKLFILTSLWEGFSNVIVESLACRTPVIAADCRSGPREILAPDSDISFETKKPEYTKFGVLMPVFNGKYYNEKNELTKEEKVWSDTVVKFIKNKKLIKKYADLAVKRADNFDIQNIIKNWDGIIN